MKKELQYNSYKLELERLYPNRVNGCVLWIDITFLWNYSDPIVPSIELIFKDGTKKIEKYQTWTPHCNKRHKVICTWIGKNKTRGGIPFHFENFEEMSQIEKIRYVWISKNDHSEVISIHDHDVSFENTGYIYVLKVLDTRLIDIVKSTYLPLMETKKNYELILSILKDAIIRIKEPLESEKTILSLIFEKTADITFEYILDVERKEQWEINYCFRNIILS